MNLIEIHITLFLIIMGEGKVIVQTQLGVYVETVIGSRSKFITFSYCSEFDLIYIEIDGYPFGIIEVYGSIYRAMKCMRSI